MHRKRKHDIHIVVKDYPVKVFLFDLLYLNGEDYTVKPIIERRTALEKIVRETEDFMVAKYIKTSDPEELEKFFMQAISEGCEGVMVKAIHKDSIYQAGARGFT